MISPPIHRNLTRDLLLIFLLSFSVLPPAFAVATEKALLTVTFPGLSAIHTAVRVADGLPNVAEGDKVRTLNWRTDGFEVSLNRGEYDLELRQGERSLVIDGVDCSGERCEVDIASVQFSLSFTGLSGVHTRIRLDDEVSGLAEGVKVMDLNWKNDGVEAGLLPGRFDLEIRHGNNRHIVDGIDCPGGPCRVEVATPLLQVEFAGLNGVHTRVRRADGIDGIAEGERIADANWKNQRTELRMLPGLYDLELRHGSERWIYDDLACFDEQCVVDVAPPQLTVAFAGMYPVHSKIRVSDDNAGTIDGARVADLNWKGEQTQLTVLPGRYDIKVTGGGSSRLFDDVVCASGSPCGVDLEPVTMAVEFPGLSNVHTAVHVADGNDNEASGDRLLEAKWKHQRTELTLFPGRFDLVVRYGKATHIIDDVECRGSDCTVDVNPATLTVSFPGLDGVKTKVRVDDGIEGSASGRLLSQTYWDANQVQHTLLPQRFDVEVTQGGATRIFDSVDCTNGSCLVDARPSNISVKFAGLSGVKVIARNDDGLAGQASGRVLKQLHWQSDQAQLLILPPQFDLELSLGAVSYIFDAVECEGGECELDVQPATMAVRFPGFSGVHTEVLESDGVAGSAEGGRFTRVGWKNDEISLLVFPQRFDVTLTLGSMVQIFDEVDCSSGSCAVELEPATMKVLFPGLSGVHTYVKAADEIDNSATGKGFISRGWQENEVELLVFPQEFDVEVKKGPAIEIFDEVDCSSGSCVVDLKPATLTVNFPGLSGVHTTVRMSDGVEQSAEGDQFTRMSWKNEQTEIAVFPQQFDLTVEHGPSEQIIDDVDCREGSCEVNVGLATLAVEFPGLSNVHTRVRLDDGEPDAASGRQIINSNWKSDATEVSLLNGVYDLEIRRGAGSMIVDQLDCSGSRCSVDTVAAQLTISFPGLTGVHSKARVADGIDGSASGGEISRLNGQNHGASFATLRQIVDVEVRQGSNTLIFDNVDCTSGACALTVAGDVQAMLIDGDSALAIPNQRIDAYEKRPDGSLNRVQRGITDPLGRIHFTLPGVGDGATYVLKTQNPYGNNKRYYSPLITGPGPFPFVITRDGEYPLDTTPPEVSLTAPTGLVSVNGFEASGFASDNNEISAVELLIEGSLSGSSRLAASYDEASGRWGAQIPASALSDGETITITATAIDRARNEASATTTAQVISDTTPPEILILSHAAGESVPVTGFLLSGVVSDEIGVASLTASLNDGSSDTIVDREIAVASDSGVWTLAVQNGQIIANQLATITLTAVDHEGNLSSAQIVLVVVPVDDLAAHMVNRITFGATPALLAEVESQGAISYMEQQLLPESIDDALFESIIAGADPQSTEELQAYVLLHALYSRRQLREVMTQFWDNHFNTDIRTRRNDADGMQLSITVADELAENEQFRANALGNFADLLRISATSPAMLIYLDSISNVALDSNENYAREVMELHTLGVDGGYGDADVAGAAELFTGWGVRNGEFFFDADRHNDDAQVVLGVEIPAGGGVDQGFQLLDLLASHPSTADYLCGKLVMLLVSDRGDSQESDLVGRCASRFLESAGDDDQITQVLREILTSPEFAAEYRSKLKDPLELVVSALRNLEGISDANDLAGPIAAMGMRLFQNPVPTGWSEEGEDWISAGLLAERIRWVNQLVREPLDSAESHVDAIGLFQSRGFETAEGIVNYLLHLTMAGDSGDLELLQAINTLVGESGFDIEAPDAEARVRALLGTVLSFPQYQFH